MKETYLPPNAMNADYAYSLLIKDELERIFDSIKKAISTNSTSITINTKIRMETIKILKEYGYDIHINKNEIVISYDKEEL